MTLSLHRSDPGCVSDGLNPPPGKKGKVTPVPPTEVEQVEFDGSVVIALTVEPLVATPAPPTSRNRAYLRATL